MSIEQLARRSQATFETFVGMIYFVPEGPAHYAPLGLENGNIISALAHRLWERYQGR